MSCTHSYKTFRTHAAVTGPGTAAAAAFGSPAAAAEALERLFQAARNQPLPTHPQLRKAATSLAEAQTHALFAHMQTLGIKPPAHAQSGLPKKDAQLGYAAVFQTLQAITKGKPLPPLATALQAETISTEPHIAAMVAPYVKLIDRLYHVGTLDPNQKQTGSHEGAGLSVSLHPEAWRRIARLGSVPTHEVRQPGGRFVDFYQARKDPALMAEVWCWAKDQGYVEHGTRYVVRYRDSEIDETVSLTFDTLAEAEAEAEEYAVTVELHAGYRPTAAMTERACHTRPPNAFVQDFALGFFLEDHCPGIAGLWWNEVLSPATYSAPRGVIFLPRIAEWQFHITASDRNIS